MRKKVVAMGGAAVLAAFMLASLGCQAVGGGSPPVVRGDSAPKSSGADMAAAIADGWSCSKERRWDRMDADRGIRVKANNTDQPSFGASAGTMNAIMQILVFSNRHQDDQAVRAAAAELAKDMCSECFGNERAEYMSRGMTYSDVPRNDYRYEVRWRCED